MLKLAFPLRGVQMSKVIKNLTHVHVCNGGYLHRIKDEIK